MQKVGPQSGGSAMWERLGPYCDERGAQSQMGGIPTAELDELRRHSNVLGVRAADGAWLFPAWQFTGSGTVHAQLLPILSAFEGVDGWVVAAWLNNPHPDLDGTTPRQALRRQGAQARVTEVARHDRWTLTE